MPGRYRFPRPSRRLRQTRLEPRERQQKLESHDLPVNRRSVAGLGTPVPSAEGWPSARVPMVVAELICTMT